MIWFHVKCLDVIFIRILIKGYLKNISENEIVNFECKGIKNKNKVTYVDNDVRFNIKINDDNVMLIRDGADFINTFIFDKNKKNSISREEGENYGIYFRIRFRNY